MMSKINTPQCSFIGDIVPYMYGEIAAAELSAFESHLVDCTDCTDEFAAVADVRYSVYEWHKQEFVPLATPVISIPYEKPLATAAGSAGIFAGLRELLSPDRWPVTAAAVLAVAVCVGATAVFLLPGGEQQIAANVVEQEVMAAPTQPPAIINETVSLPASETKKAPAPAVTAKHEIRPLKRDTALPRPVPKREIAETRKAPVTANDPRPSTAAQRSSVDLPVLSSYEDSDDRSLRLADLIDDEGSSR